MDRHETPRRASRIVWASAQYDLIVTLPFTTPWTAEGVLHTLRQLHVGLGLGGELPPAFGPLHLLFVSLFGTIVSLWAVLRLLRPERLLGALASLGATPPRRAAS
jgi:hypothetical protein